MNELKTSFLNEDQLPLVVEPKDPRISAEGFLGLLKQYHPELKKQMLRYGGLLFRNCPVNNIDDFASVVDEMKIGNRLNYVGGDSPRSRIKNRVYTSTEASASFKIPLHNELSYQKNYADYISFYCETPSHTGGETIIGDARKIYKEVNPRVREMFEQKGLKYISRYYGKSKFIDFVNKIQPGHKSWKIAFDANTKEEVEIKCVENAYEHEWLKNDWLKIVRNCPATITHPETKEKVWFNQVHTFDFNPKFLGLWRYLGASLFYCMKETRVNDVCFGDGTPIPRKDIYHILDVLDRKTVKFPWQKGDVMILDNILAMHGRNPFKGSRRILTALTKE